MGLEMQAGEPTAKSQVDLCTTVLGILARARMVPNAGFQLGLYSVWIMENVLYNNSNMRQGVA